MDKEELIKLWKSCTSGLDQEDRKTVNFNSTIAVYLITTAGSGLELFIADDVTVLRT